MNNLVRIILPESRDGCPQPSSGTKVLTADGQEIVGITRIELIATPGQPWRARLDMHVVLPVEFAALLPLQDGVSVSATLYQKPPK